MCTSSNEYYLVIPTNQTENEKDFPIFRKTTKDPGHAYPFMYIHYVAAPYDVRKSPHRNFKM